MFKACLFKVELLYLNMKKEHKNAFVDFIKIVLTVLTV